MPLCYHLNRTWMQRKCHLKKKIKSLASERWCLIWFGGLQLYKAALGNCFEIDDWGPIEFSIMAKHFDRQGKPPYAYHAVSSCPLIFHLLHTQLAKHLQICILSKTRIFFWLLGSNFSLLKLQVLCVLSLCFSAIHGTPSLPWAARWKWITARCA